MEMSMPWLMLAQRLFTSARPAQMTDINILLFDPFLPMEGQNQRPEDIEPGQADGRQKQEAQEQIAVLQVERGLKNFVLAKEARPDRNSSKRQRTRQIRCI